MSIYEDYILNHREDLELIAASTNRVYRFSHEGSRYILKENNLPADRLSPFWLGIQQIFGSDFDTQRTHIEQTLALLANPHIKVAQLVAKSDKYKYQIFREAEGIPCEPDEFPPHEKIAYQLGQFIGFLHATSYDWFGSPASQLHSDFRQVMLDSMLTLIQRYWPDSPAVESFYARLCDYDISPSSYSMIMPDISANQFTFHSTLSSIEAVIDFDAYVIGPREWELSVIEMCLQNGDAFKKGYEQYLPFPDLTGHREFYRFFMYLCDPWENQELTLFLNRNIIF